MKDVDERSILSNTSYDDTKYTTNIDSSFNVSSNKLLLENENSINKFRNGTIFSSTVNLINCNVGIGTVGLSYGILQSGYILAIVFFMIFHFINHITVYMMMEIGATMAISSYAIVCSKCNVSWLYMLNEWSLVIELILSCTSYLIIIGDFMRLIILELFPNNISNIYYNRRFWILTYLIFLIIPTTILRRINSLQYVSFIGILCFIYFVFIVFIYIDDENIENDDIFYNQWPNDSSPLLFFRTMSLVVMAYGGHVIVFAQVSELKNPSINRINKIVWLFSTTSTFIFVSIGFGAYFTFGNIAMDNILLNYPNSLISINILRIMLCIALSFSYSILTNTIKNSLGSILFGIGIKNDKYSLYKLIYLDCIHKGIDNTQNKNKRENQNINNIQAYKFYILVFLIIAITLTISLSTNNLGFLFQLNGATAAAFNQIIFPGLIYFYAYNNLKSDELRQRKYSKCKYYLSISIALFGIILVPFMVYFAIDSVL